MIEIRRDDLLMIYVDADAYPVKKEVFRVAERHLLLTRVLRNSWLRLPTSPLIEQYIVPEELDAADNWIVEHITVGDVVVTADIQLAARCLKKTDEGIAAEWQVLLGTKHRICYCHAWTYGQPTRSRGNTGNQSFFYQARSN